MPYLATSITDFWHRWHITLSTWLRDYLYVPLGGNRHGALATLRNLMITMLLGGLWHGAQWTFVAWGGFHGVLLCVERSFRHRARGEPAQGACRGRSRYANLLPRDARVGFVPLAQLSALPLRSIARSLRAAPGRRS